MNILLYGATEMSYLIASQLHQQHDITVLIEDGERVEHFSNLDVSQVEGSGGDIAILEQIGAGQADVFIACSILDEANIVACWTVKKVANAETICFIGKPALYRNFSSTAHNHYHTRYDIDSIIWPEQLLTQEMFRIISVPDALDVEILAGGKAKLFEYRINETSTLVDKKISECDFPKDILISGITREDKLFIPNGSTLIYPGDKVIFIGTGPALDSLAADFFHSTSRVKSVSIIGGGSVGFMLAELLEKLKIRVKIIEHATNRCEFLANSLKRALVIKGDGMDLDLLESEAIAESDVCVCTTNNDEKNLLCSLLVKQLGSKRTITRIGNSQNYELFARLGIDVVVSPKASALTEVLNHVQTQDVDVLALIEGGKGEVLRLTVPETFKEVMISELKFSANAIIGVIIRGHRVLIPDGNTSVYPGDRLKVFTMKEDSESIKGLFFS
jgi:trk system potassium uptake protein TrkA